MENVRIPDAEYADRIHRASVMIREKQLDVLFVCGTESDYANPRYFSGFWPLFERAGVAVSAAGEAALMVGPESGIFAADRSKIDRIFVLKEFRESADPSYPELKAETFADVFRAIGVSGEHIRIGLGSYMDCTLPYTRLEERIP